MPLGAFVSLMHAITSLNAAVAEGSLGDDFDEDVAGDPEEPDDEEELDDRRAAS